MKIEKSLIFYNEDNVSTIKNRTQSWKVYRAMNLPLAEPRNTAPKDYHLLATDKNGTVIQTADPNNVALSYTPYGQAPKLQLQSSVLGFNGEKIEHSIHGYLLGLGHHRAYHLGLMRFLSPDTFSPNSIGGINTYSYCGNDPINHTDPSGHFRIRSLLGHTFRPKLPKRIKNQNNAPLPTPLPSYEVATGPTPPPTPSPNPPTYAETMRSYPAERTSPLVLKEIKKLQPLVDQYESYLRQQAPKHLRAEERVRYARHATEQLPYGSDLWRHYSEQLITAIFEEDYYYRKIAKITSEQKRLQEYVSTLRGTTS